MGVMTGPALVLVDGGSLAKPNESIETAYAANAGLHWRISENAAITFDYRFMFIRGFVPNMGGISGGGNWMSIGFTWFLHPEISGMSSMRGGGAVL